MKKFSSNYIFEFVTLKDLKNDAGMSALSKFHKAVRFKRTGSETRASKLINSFINQDGSVDFVFKSIPTPYPNEPGHQYKRADKRIRYQLAPNNEKIYTITIKIKDFLHWLETHPRSMAITAKDIKDIFDVSNIEIDSNVPSFYWQGGAYNLQKLGGTIFKHTIPAPKWWNQPGRHGDGQLYIDKITQGIINQIEFFKNIMAQMLTKKLREGGYLKDREQKPVQQIQQQPKEQEPQVQQTVQQPNQKTI